MEVTCIGQDRKGFPRSPRGRWEALGRHRGTLVIDRDRSESEVSTPRSYLILERHELCLFGWLVGLFTSSSTTRLYRGRVPRLTSDNFMCCHTRDRAGRPWLLSQPITLYWHRPQPVGSGWPQREWNPRPSVQESRALQTELPRPGEISTRHGYMRDVQKTWIFDFRERWAKDVDIWF